MKTATFPTTIHLPFRIRVKVDILKTVTVTMSYAYRRSTNAGFIKDNVMCETKVGSRAAAINVGFETFRDKFDEKFGRDNWILNKMVVTGDEDLNFWA